MTRSWFPKWLSPRPARPIRVDRRPDRRLSVEALESRLVPATIDLISVADNATSGNGAASLGTAASAVSADGRYVVFESNAGDLIAGQNDANGVRDVFLRDRQANTTTLVSHQGGLTNATGNFQSFDPSVSADGRFVVYRSIATNLVSGQVDGSNYDVFLFDSQTGTNTLVSYASGAAATAGNNASSFARISADGNYVTFVSRSTNLLPNQSTFDLNSTDDVFLYSRATGTNALVSRTSLGGTGNGAADLPSVCDDGRYVAYRTSATNVTSGVTDNNGNTDVYLYDRVTDTRVLVSRSGNSATVVALGQSDAPAVSGDGAYVAFVSYAGNVVQNQSDDNLSTDVFLYFRASGTNVLVSHLADDPTVAGDNYADSPVLSADGRYVAYVSASSNLTAGQTDTNFDADVFLYDRLAGASVLVSHTSLDAATTGDTFSTAPSISSDGRYVAYASVASDLVSGVSDTNSTFDVFRYDRVTGLTTMVSHVDGDEVTTPSQGAEQPQICGDGTVVAFTSETAD
jgi:Tol biopolymer transport system component